MAEIWELYDVDFGITLGFYTRQKGQFGIKIKQNNKIYWNGKSDGKPTTKPFYFFCLNIVYLYKKKDDPLQGCGNVIKIYLTQRLRPKKIIPRTPAQRAEYCKSRNITYENENNFIDMTKGAK